MKAVLPFRGEFGLTVRYHVPAVRALARPLVVCHESGMEALYPECERILVDTKPDATRRDVYAGDRDYVAGWQAELKRRYPGAEVVAPDRSQPWPEQRFVPEPFVSQNVGAYDVVICPRFRLYGPSKNWNRWPALATALARLGLRAFAAGAAETSDRNCRVAGAAWKYPRPLDASIEAMRHARLVIATDNGLAHLAVLCGTPLLLIGAAGGRVAPGPIKDELGRIIEPHYNRIRLRHYYRDANHMGSPIDLEPDGWAQPRRVAARAKLLLLGRSRVAG